MTTETETHGRPSSGVVVLELTAAVAGPYATRLLADLGADVIRVERPPEGDLMRTYAPPDVVPGPSFLYTSAGKRSLGIDISLPEGRDVVKALISHVDVVVENMTPGTVEKLGLGYEILRALKPDLVMCSISGFGQDGPWRETRGTDPAMQAWTGVASMIGEPNEAPYIDRTAPCDTMTASQAALAISAALYYRARTGLGQHIDISLMDTVVSLDCQILPLVLGTRGRRQPQRAGRFHPLGHAAVVRAPEHYMVVEFDGEGATSSWERLAAAMSRPDLVGDPRFSDDEARLANRDDLVPILDGWLIAFPSDATALAALKHAGVNAAPILSPWEAINQPQLTARSMVREVPQPDGSTSPIQASPYHFSDTQIQVGRAPGLGEHNGEVLRLFLGYSDEQLAGLRDRGVIQGDEAVPGR